MVAKNQKTPTTIDSRAEVIFILLQSSQVKIVHNTTPVRQES